MDACFFPKQSPIPRTNVRRTQSALIWLAPTSVTVSRASRATESFAKMSTNVPWPRTRAAANLCALICRAATDASVCLASGEMGPTALTLTSVPRACTTVNGPWCVTIRSEPSVVFVRRDFSWIRMNALVCLWFGSCSSRTVNLFNPDLDSESQLHETMKSVWLKRKE